MGSPAGGSGRTGSLSQSRRPLISDLGRCAVTLPDDPVVGLLVPLRVHRAQAQVGAPDTCTAHQWATRLRLWFQKRSLTQRGEPDQTADDCRERDREQALSNYATLTCSNPSISAMRRSIAIFSSLGTPEASAPNIRRKAFSKAGL